MLGVLADMLAVLLFAVRGLGEKHPLPDLDNASEGKLTGAVVRMPCPSFLRFMKPSKGTQ
jgi:hypothetical protein